MPVKEPTNPTKGGRYRECTAAMEEAVHLLMSEAMEKGWTKGEIRIALIQCGVSHPGAEHAPEFDVPAPSGVAH